MSLTIGQRAALFALGIITLGLSIIALSFAYLMFEEQEFALTAAGLGVGAFAFHSARRMLEGDRV